MGELQEKLVMQVWEDLGREMVVSVLGAVAQVWAVRSL
jgi:hypothetical protein